MTQRPLTNFFTKSPSPSNGSSGGIGGVAARGGGDASQIEGGTSRLSWEAVESTVHGKQTVVTYKKGSVGPSKVNERDGEVGVASIGSHQVTKRRRSNWPSDATAIRAPTTPLPEKAKAPEASLRHSRAAEEASGWERRQAGDTTVPSHMEDGRHRSTGNGYAEGAFRHDPDGDRYFQESGDAERAALQRDLALPENLDDLMLGVQEVNEEDESVDILTMDSADESVPPPPPAPTANLDSAKKRRRLLAAVGVEDEATSGREDAWAQARKRFDWLQRDKVRDGNGRRPGEAGFDKRTVTVPPDVLRSKSKSQRQYWETKCLYMDTVLFFKVGTFYELYELDAEIGHRELGWKMTVSGVGKCFQVGIPESGVDEAIQKLVGRGYKVGRMEQMETAQEAKRKRGAQAVVERVLTQVYTPATMADGNLQADAVHLLALKEPRGGGLRGSVATESPNRVYWSASIEEKCEIMEWIRAQKCSHAEAVEHFRGRFPKLTRRVINKWFEDRLSLDNFVLEDEATSSASSLEEFPAALVPFKEEQVAQPPVRRGRKILKQVHLRVSSDEKKEIMDYVRENKVSRTEAVAHFKPRFPLLSNRTLMRWDLEVKHGKVKQKRRKLSGLTKLGNGGASSKAFVSSLGRPPIIRWQATVAEKLEVLDWLREQKCSQIQAVKHFKSSKLPGINKGVLSRWVRDEAKLREFAEKRCAGSAGQDLGYYRVKGTSNEAFEVALTEWVAQQGTSNIPPSRIREAAYDVYDKLGVKEEDRLLLSCGWMGKFQRRHRLFPYGGGQAAPLEICGPSDTTEAADD